jgi:hypothetical protein
MDSKFIVFRAYNPKRQMPIKLSPLENKSESFILDKVKEDSMNFSLNRRKKNLVTSLIELRK